MKGPHKTHGGAGRIVSEPPKHGEALFYNDSTSTARQHFQATRLTQRRAMRIVAGTYEGFCYGWESNSEPVVAAAPAGLPKTTEKNSEGLDASQPPPSKAAAAAAAAAGSGSAPQPLSLVFGYNVHVGCMKSVAMATSGTRAGQLLVTGGADERVRIYDLRDRTELGELQQHNGAHEIERGDGCG